MAPDFKSFSVLWFAMALALGTPIRALEPASGPAIPQAASQAVGLDIAINKLHAPTRNTAPLSPKESLTKFKPAPGLAVDLVAAEPEVRQPLCINFDSRGRMWVTQYIQYPFPAGLKIVEYDNYLRAKFDKVPAAPPKGPRGKDRITIHEDVNGDGSFSKVTTFLDGLNIATSALPDHDGVWVMNPPYLLFYPDRNHDDVPDGDPIVHLSGFGLEDTHAVASNLTWGPDGWIYGAHGSTCTSKVKVEITGDTKTTDFLGQAIWRYHPIKHIFELFAEGGGNTFGVAFDSQGRIYSGTNWGNFRGLHYVQGGYYLKNWGKHGPLTNPYAFGFFDHMPHTGDAARLTHTFAVYDGGLLPESYNGKLIGPNPLMSRVQVTRLEPNGSTYKTVEEPPLLTSDDGWFRPVDAKVGPDGAIYVADFYENRISHVDPRDNWDRSTGRIYRIRPIDWKPGIKPFDLAKMPNEELVRLLEDKNGWFRAAARKALAGRRDLSIVPRLTQRLAQNKGRLALESLWTLNLLGALDDSHSMTALNHPDPPVRSWTVRLIGDARQSPAPALAAKLVDLAAHEADVQVRSQIASTAKRLPQNLALAILEPMFRRDEDAKDPHIPLLLWWALEPQAAADPDRVAKLFENRELWQKQIVRETILRRLARRWAAEATAANQMALVKLIHSAPGDAERKLLYAGINDAFEGREIVGMLSALADELARSGDLELALRGRDEKAAEQALGIIEKEDSALTKQRVHYIDLLGQLQNKQAIVPMLRIAAQTKADLVRRAAIAALARFDDPIIASLLLHDLYPLLKDESARAAIISALVSRPAWAAELLTAVESGKLPKSQITTDKVDRMRRLDDPALAARVETLFGKARKASSEQKTKEIERLRGVITAGAGDPSAGKTIFTARCAACHTLFAEGGHIGPDLTSYDRRNLDFLLTSIVDPSAYVREEFTTFRVKTTDHRTLEGLIVERGQGQITIMDSAGQKTVVAKTQILEERALPISLMPEELLTGLSDREVRDLFGFLTKDR